MASSKNSAMDSSAQFSFIVSQDYEIYSTSPHTQQNNYSNKPVTNR